MTTDQPSPSAEEPEFIGVIHLRYPEKGAPAEVFRHFEWTSEDARVTGDVSRGEAGVAITRVEVTATPPSGITHAILRSMPLGEVLKAARTELQQEQATPIRAHSAFKLPPGRVTVTDELLREVALAYIEETSPGKERQANRRLAERFGRPEGTVRTWVARARKEGWLAPGSSGRMSAESGPKLLEWYAATGRHFTAGLLGDDQAAHVEDESHYARLFHLLAANTDPDSSIMKAINSKEMELSDADKGRLLTFFFGVVGEDVTETVSKVIPAAQDFDREKFREYLLQELGRSFAQADNASRQSTHD